MRKYLHIDLATRDVRTETFSGEQIARAGRYFIAKTLNELGVATVDAMSADNPLIFSAGPFAGSNFSNANRTSVGCKSPLTGGVKRPTRAVRSASRWASSRSRASPSTARRRSGP